MDIIINLEIKNNVILVCTLFLFVCGEEGKEVRSVPVLQLKMEGQILFKLSAGIEKGTDLV